MQLLNLAVSGMSCGHCLNAVRQALEGSDAVKVRSVRIGRAEVEYDPDRTTPEQICTAVREAGYDAVVV